MKILFLCGSNSCRSQMAEGLMRAIAAEGTQVQSGGVTAGRVHPVAIQVMREIGIDISGHTSKAVADLVPATFDLVITLCEAAREYCPLGFFVGAPARLHWPIEDPAEAQGDEARVLDAFRGARDIIREHLQGLLDHGFLSALSEQRRRLAHLADLLDDGIIAHDDSRNIFLFNRAAQEITGRAPDEIMGRDCHTVFPPDGLCGTQCLFREGGRAPREKTEYQVTFTNARGENKRLKMTASPFVIDEGRPSGVLAVIRDVTEISDLKWKLEERSRFHGMIGVSGAVRAVFDTIRSVAASDYPVLISGESGTGKELAARAIHNESRRGGGPFVPVNCGALPDGILESELFGHVRGAFTGAIREKKGRFELADGGTLFLDEVGELPPGFQVKLLRVLQEKTFERVGGEKPIRVDVRIISATNRDLRKRVREGAFREDLFYRLCVVPIALPPLRERRDGFPFLVDHILEDIRKETGRERLRISPESMTLMQRYAWPGNIRELNNALQFASVNCREGEILPDHLPPEIRAGGFSKEQSVFENPPDETKRKRKSKLKRGAVELALSKAKGNKVKAAKILGVGRATLYRFLNDHPDLPEV